MAFLPFTRQSTYETFDQEFKSWDNINTWVSYPNAADLVTGQINEGVTVRIQHNHIITEDVHVSNQGTLILEPYTILRVYGKLLNQGEIQLKNRSQIEFFGNEDGINYHNNLGFIEIQGRSQVVVNANANLVNRPNGRIRLRNGGIIEIKENGFLTNLNTSNGILNSGLIEGSGTFQYIDNANVIDQGNGSVHEDVIPEGIKDDDVDPVSFETAELTEHADPVLNLLYDNVVKPLVANKYDDVSKYADKLCCAWSDGECHSDSDLKNTCDPTTNPGNPTTNPGIINPGKTKIELLCCSDDYVVRHDNKTNIALAIKKETRRHVLNILSNTIRNLQQKGEILTTFSSIVADSNVNAQSSLVKSVQTNRSLTDHLYDMSLTLAQLALNSGKIRNVLLDVLSNSNNINLDISSHRRKSDAFDQQLSHYRCLGKADFRPHKDCDPAENDLFPRSCAIGTAKWEGCEVSTAFHQLLDCEISTADRFKTGKACQLSKLFYKVVQHASNLNNKVATMLSSISTINRNLVFGHDSDIERGTLNTVGATILNEPGIMMNTLNYLININSLNIKDSSTKKRWIEFLTSENIEAIPKTSVLFDTDFKLTYKVSDLQPGDIDRVVDQSILAEYKPHIIHEIKNVLILLKDLYVKSLRVAAILQTDQSQTPSVSQVTPQIAPHVVPQAILQVAPQVEEEKEVSPVVQLVQAVSPYRNIIVLAIIFVIFCVLVY